MTNTEKLIIYMAKMIDHLDSKSSAKPKAYSLHVSKEMAQDIKHAASELEKSK